MTRLFRAAKPLRRDKGADRGDETKPGGHPVPGGVMAMEAIETILFSGRREGVAVELIGALWAGGRVP